MASLAHRIADHVRLFPGCTEAELARAVIGPNAVQQQVNPTVRKLVEQGVLVRNTQARPFTYIAGKELPAIEPHNRNSACTEFPSEDETKVILRDHLTQLGYEVKVAMGFERGIDIDARRGQERWIIEVKGPGSRPEMRVNYFLAMLGELLQRMDDESARYSIALPDIPQFRRLWNRLPQTARDRTGITAIFVSLDSQIHQVP